MFGLLSQVLNVSNVIVANQRSYQCNFILFKRKKSGFLLYMSKGGGKSMMYLIWNKP